MVHDSEELVNDTGVNVLWNIVQETSFFMETPPNKYRKVTTQDKWNIWRDPAEADRYHLIRSAILILEQKVSNGYWHGGISNKKGNNTRIMRQNYFTSKEEEDDYDNQWINSVEPAN